MPIETNVKVYKNFLDMPAPAGYVAGVGRGEVGFVTRSDIGPAGAMPDEKNFKTKVVRRYEDEGETIEDENQELRFEDAENEEGLLASGALDAEDLEADRIYNQIDERMEERRRARREARDKEEQEEAERQNPKISKQFADLKRALGSVSVEQWASIPEVGDLTRRNKRARKEVEKRIYAVPDTVLSGVRNAALMDSSIDTAPEGTMTDFETISSAKDKMLNMRLDQASGTASTISKTVDGSSSTIDPKGYLTSLATLSSNSSVELGDIRRVRPLLESLVKAAPKDPRGWIGLARLEEIAKRPQKARNVIEQGCQNCPSSEDVWLESMRLNEKKYARVLAANAVQRLPHCINIWLAASRLEDDESAKKRVIQRALENNPNSDTLWRAALNLENDPEDARLLLAQAVELVPMSEDLWLSLARLETPANAKKVLSKARKVLRVSRAVWIAASQLVEQESEDTSKVNELMANGVKDLELKGGLPDRTQWIADAQECERQGAILTSHAIINATLGQGLEEEDTKAVWLDDAKSAIENQAFDTARAICAYALRVFPESRSLWLATINLERAHGTKPHLWEVLDRATKSCPKSEAFWLLYAQEKSRIGDIDGARAVLSKAFERNSNNEEIWLAAVNLEVENKNYDMAKELLAKARSEACTERIFVKSVVFERQMKRSTRGLEIATAGLKKFPQCAKLYMQMGQIHEALEDLPSANSVYAQGVKACPKSVPLWLLQAKSDEKQGVIIRARSVLDRASLVNDKNERLWYERIKLEQRSKNSQQAQVLMARAIQECPTSGLLWSENVWMQSPIQRRTRILDAVKACENDAFVLTTVGRDFWMAGKPKALTWLERATRADPDNGDSWLWLVKYLEERGSQEERQKKIDDFEKAEPCHGLIWPVAVKNVENFGKTRKQIFLETVASLQK
jgi:pre-mRNA-processing factor 6